MKRKIVSQQAIATCLFKWYFNFLQSFQKSCDQYFAIGGIWHFVPREAKGLSPRPLLWAFRDTQSEPVCCVSCHAPGQHSAKPACPILLQRYAACASGTELIFCFPSVVLRMEERKSMISKTSSWEGHEEIHPVKKLTVCLILNIWMSLNLYVLSGDIFMGP